MFDKGLQIKVYNRCALGPIVMVFLVVFHEGEFGR